MRRARQRFGPAVIFAAAALAGCDAGGRPPSAEFLVSAGDSTYWVRSTRAGVNVRGSPMVITHVDGRFRELYVVDEDHSYESAVFVGQRLFQRDLASGDSTQIFRDSLVPALAAAYERRNPGARRLAPDEDTAEEPALTATAEVSVIGVHGPFLSLEYHADTSGEGDSDWHMTRHAVIDLRTGRPATLADVVGAEQASVVLTRARTLFRETLDSIRRDRRPSARRAARSLGSFRFDPASFSLTAPSGTLMIAFSAPGRGSGGEGFTLPIRPLTVAQPEWWLDARAALPTLTADGEELWSRGSYVVRARYDTVAGSVRLALLDSAGRAFDVGGVTGPVHRIYWLDRPPVERPQRSALSRAFDESQHYDASARTAHHSPPERVHLVRQRPTR